MIEGVAGVIIWTGDFPGLLRFYRDTLGLTPRSVKESFVSFEFGSFRLNIAVHSAVSGRTAEPLRIMVNLATTDIRTDCERLSRAGVRFIRQPERERWGWVATFEDPNGNVLQLMQLA